MKLNVLIVDDKEENRYLLESILKGSGHTVVSTENGEEAWTMALGTPPDLVISDILMPVMDGFTLCKKWKAHQSLRKIPFVFYTATYTESKDEEFAYHLGADLYLIKPQDPKVFLKQITDLLDKFRKGVYKAPVKPSVSETIQLREYNQVLIRKLEDKMSEAEKSNRQLKEVLDRYKTLLATAPDAIFIVNADCRIIESNARAGELFGYTGAEFLELEVLQLHTKADRAAVLEAVDNIHAGKPYRNEWKYKRKDGTFFWGALSSFCHPGIGTQSIIRDITTAVRARRKIKKQLEELRQWYEVTLGREERVIELKMEVNALRAELKKPTQYDL